MQFLRRLHVSLRRQSSIQVPVRPHIRQFFYPPAAAMDLSTDATERVRMSPLRTERVRLTVMAEGLGAS
jgi:hypothetical protein